MKQLIRRVQRHRIVVALCAIQSLLLAVGCGKEPASPAPGTEPSTISFSYTGVRQDTYHANGRPTLTNDSYLNRSDYAAAVTYPGESTRLGTVSIIANDTAGRAYGNLLLMQGIPARTATVPISQVVSGAFYLGPTWNESRFDSDTIYLLDSGEITVSEYSMQRVRGTFRATAYEFASLTPNRQRTISISNGRFDLAVDDSSAASFRCRLFSCPATTLMSSILHRIAAPRSRTPS